MTILLTLLIIVLGVAAVWLMRLSKAGNASAGPAAGMCAVLVIILAVVRIFSSGSAPDTKAILAQHEQYQAACGEVLGEHLVARHPEARVVVLTPPGASAPGAQALLDQMQAVLEEGGLTVTRKPLVIPEAIKARMAMPDDPAMTPEMKTEYESMMLQDTTMWFDAAALNELLLDLKNQADLVISTVVFPEPLEADSLLPKGRGPALVLLNAYLPEPEPLLQRSVLDTVVSHRNNADAWKPGAKVPKDPQAAFDQRYVLVSAGR